MIIKCVTVYVKKEHIQDFIDATMENHKNSIKEDGNLRFDVLQCRDDETKFFLYEAYETDEASAKHSQTSHFIKWRDTVEPWMSKPRERSIYSEIAPVEKDLW